MPEKHFKHNKNNTVGVELELQLIDEKTKELTTGTTKILKSLGNYQNIKHELFESVIEINSSPCLTINELKDDLKKHVKVLHECAAKHGIKLAMAGTHPSSNWAHQEISPIKRYQQIVDKIQMPVKRMLIFGLHVHVGVATGDEAIAVNNALMNYLPHLLALSCSSPYWVKRDSGMESYRVKILETLPTTGLPFKLHSYEEYIDLVNVLKKAGTIESIREIWWDVRPHPDFGTVEVRVCDAMPLMDDVLAMAALIQSLIAHLSKMFRVKDEIGHLPSFLIRENKWRAARYGIDAELITDSFGKIVPMRKEIEKLFNEIEPTAKEINADKELNKIWDIFKRGTSSKRQRKIHSETNGNWNAIVDSLINEFEESWQLKKVTTV
ncbi:MAG: carboxylate-amine ligase [Candidatus Melainabacteria bacterium RIFCSPHIGHO2_02_FULL_34_12]|nr:MAG: carboxylate-amine ligase [Candidatus Melainabacteria bacterium RIFCSPHIGHO2_02_FULL_34_12]